MTLCQTLSKIFHVVFFIMSCLRQFNIILYIFFSVNSNGCLDVGKIRGTDVSGSFKKKFEFCIQVSNKLEFCIKSIDIKAIRLQHATSSFGTVCVFTNCNMRKFFYRKISIVFSLFPLFLHVIEYLPSTTSLLRLLSHQPNTKSAT